MSTVSLPDQKGPITAKDPPFSDVLKQVFFESPNDIAKPEMGQKICRKIYSDQTSSETNLNYFRARAVKWINILKWATGIQDQTEFLDFFNIVDGTKAYVKIDMSPIMVGPKFMGTLVDVICANEEYPCVTAVDNDSVEEKEERKNSALYRMRHTSKIDALQQQSGMMLEDPNAYVPDDELSARLHFELEDRLEKEIDLEKKLARRLEENKFERIMKRRTGYDLICHNIGVTKIERTGTGGYCIRKPVVQNCFYNYLVGDSGMHELGYFGELYNLKCRDLRTKYGQSPTNPKGLTEKEIYELVKQATVRNSGWFNFGWREEYSIYNYNRPWDDLSIYVMDMEIQLNLSDYYVNKTDNLGKDNIVEKKGVPKPTSEKSTVLKRNKNRWYHAIYCPYSDKIIKWGLPDIVLTKYSDTEEALSSYSVNIPFNNGQYVPSLFERAMEPIKEYALLKLKRKQLIAKIRPSGIRIDVESARNLDLGNGNSIPWEEVVRIFDQTGNELWSSKDVDPLVKANPAISNTAADDAVMKIIQLTQIMESCLQEIRNLLGVSLYLEGADVGDRTSGKLAQSQAESGSNVISFIFNAQNELWEETLYKCALIEWQKEVKEYKPTPDGKDPVNSKFAIAIKMRMTEEEKVKIESLIANGIAAGMLTPKDALYIREIKNFKLAQLYLSNTEDKNKRDAQMAQSKNVQENSQAQQASNQAAAENEAKMLIAKQQFEMQMQREKLKQEKDKDTITGLLNVIAKLGSVPPVLEPLLMLYVQNETLQLREENEDIRQEIASKYQQLLAQHLATQKNLAQQGMQQNGGSQMQSE